MDFELSEDQRAFADTARQFAEAEFAPHAEGLARVLRQTGGGNRRGHARRPAAFGVNPSPQAGLPSPLSAATPAALRYRRQTGTAAAATDHTP